MDVRIAVLAEAQYGVVSRRQLIRLGISERMIDHRVAIRRLRQVHLGIYAVGSQHLGVYGSHAAAVLATAGVIGYRSAAALLDLRNTPSGAVAVVVPKGRRWRRSGIELHSSRQLLPVDATVVDGIPCTTVARTLVDLAAIEPRHTLERMLDKAMMVEIFDLNAFNELLARSAGRRGIGRLRHALATLTDAPSFERKELEHRFGRLVRVTGLPPPVVNATVAGYVVDFHWPAARLVVETDSRAHHTSNKAFEQDRQRDLDLQLAGWKTVRITWSQLREQPEQVVALLRTHLDRRPSQPARYPPRGDERATRS